MHYLRTTNPINPENLAQYPHRIGTTGPTRTRTRAAFAAARPRLPVFENRQLRHGTDRG